MRNPLPYRLHQQQQYVQQLRAKLNFSLKQHLQARQHHLAHWCGKLDSLSPLKVLARGYSIAENPQGEAVRQLAQVNVGELLTTRVGDGCIISRVEKKVQK